MYGHTCILIIVDVFRKFTKLYGLRGASSAACLRKIRQYAEENGRPARLISDNGPQFSSRSWKRGLLALGIKEVHAALRNPRGNPCERYVKTVGVCLRITCGSKHSSWARNLGRIEEFINYNYSEAASELPIEAQFGRRFPLEIERVIKYPPAKEHVDWEEIRGRVYKKLLMQAERRHKYHHSRLLEFQPGQWVLVRKGWTSSTSREVSAKLNPLFVGPAKVYKRIGRNTYLIQMSPNDNKYKTHNIITFNLITTELQTRGRP